MRRAQRIRRDWPAILQAQAASGLSVAAFCRQQHVPRRQLYRWRQLLSSAKATSTASPFIELRPSPIASAGVTVVAPNGWRIEVAAAFDQATLARLLTCLASATACSI